MKLSNITEAKSRTPIRDAASALALVIDTLQQHYPKNSEEQLAFNRFLSNPSSNTWKTNKWVIDNIIKTGYTKGISPDQLSQIAYLNTLTSPTIAASVYDIDRSKARNTPISNIALDNVKRNRLKRALGPIGYVSSLANISNKMNDSQLRRHLRFTANSQIGLNRAAMKDLPNIHLLKRF